MNKSGSRVEKFKELRLAHIPWIRVSGYDYQPSNRDKVPRADEVTKEESIRVIENTKRFLGGNYSNTVLQISAL